MAWTEQDVKEIKEFEKKHPRGQPDNAGQFVEKGSESDKEKAKEKNKSQEEFFGEEFKGVKGAAAIDKLLQEKRGYVQGAFHREDIGDIALPWGNEAFGLQHIITQREKQGIDSRAFLRDLPQVIENGSFYQKSERGNFEFIHNGKMAVIAPEYRGNKITFVLTAYKTRKKAPSNDDA